MKVLPLNNTIGIHYQKEGSIKIANEKWKLIVYKDLELLEKAFDHNQQILSQIESLFSSSAQLSTFAIPIRPQINLLNTIIKRINFKLNEIKLETPQREKRGLINGLGSIWKSITGNLDSSDGEFYNNCIDKLERDDREIQNLLKDQIQVTTSTIRNFNYTIRKLQIDEETLNQDLVQIENEIQKLNDYQYSLLAHIKTLTICEQILESLVLIENELSDILNSIAFAHLKVLHPSIIKPDELIEQLVKIPASLVHNNLPLKANQENLSKLITLMKVQAFQTTKRLIFILEIPLVEFQKYSLLHVFALPTRDPRTSLFHAIIPLTKFVALSENSRNYIPMSSIDDCDELDEETNLCYNKIPQAIDTNAACEVKILVKFELSDTCQPSIFAIEDYNIQKLQTNQWLIVTARKMPLTTTCPNSNPATIIIPSNSIIQLQPRCSAYFGTTQLYAASDDSSNVTDKLLIPDVPYDCCEHLPEAKELPPLKPLKINKLNLDELKVAEHKLNQYQERLNSIMNEPFASKHWSVFTYVIVIAVTLIILWLICRCCLKRKLIGYFVDSRPNDDSHPGPYCPQIFNYCNVRSRITRRPSLHLETTYETNSEEIVFQSPDPSVPVSRAGNPKQSY